MNDRPQISNNDDGATVVETKSVYRSRIAVVLIPLVILGLVGLYLSSFHFKQQVLRKVVSELERTTGGRVELHSFTWNLRNFEFIADDLTIHGLEVPTEIPYVHIDRLDVRVKIVSLFRREIGLSSLIAEHPVLHLIVYPNGDSNQPVPKARASSPALTVVQILDLAIDRLEVHNGLIIWNDRRIPLDFRAADVISSLSYSNTDLRYEGRILSHDSDLLVPGIHPLSGRVGLNFSLTSHEMLIHSLRLRTPQSSFIAHGRMTDFADPKVELEYDSSVDIAELGKSFDVPELRAGKLGLKGNGNISFRNHTAQFESHGLATLTNMDWHNVTIHVAAINGMSSFTVDNDHLGLPDISASLLGGSTRGHADVYNWSAPAQPVASGAIEHGHGDFQFSGLQVAALARSASSRNAPFADLNAEGQMKGTVTLQWRQLAKADAQINMVTTTPPASHSAGAIPVTARLRGNYHLGAGTFDIAELTLSTSSTHLTASGVMGRESSQLNLNIDTEKLREWEPLLKGIASISALQVRGAARFYGTMAGGFAYPILHGHLELADFDTFITRTPPAKTLTITWKKLAADVQYSPWFLSIANGFVRRGNSSVIFSGRSNLDHGKWIPNSAFLGNFQLRSAPLNELQAIFGASYPITGTVDLAANFSGTENNIHGNGTIHLSGGEIFGEAYKSFQSDLVVAGQQVRLSKAVFSQDGGVVSGNAAYDFSTRAFNFDTVGANIDLAHIKFLQQPRLNLAGMAKFHAMGSGTLDHPVISGNLQIAQLVGNGESMGGLNASAVTRDRHLLLNAQSHLNKAELLATGAIQLEGDFPGQLSLRFQRLDVDPFLRGYLGDRMTGHSSADGTVQVQGTLKHLRLLSGTGTVDQFSAELERIALHNQGPLVFEMKDGTLDVRQFHITGENTDLQASGTVEIKDLRKIDIRANGLANLKLFQGLSPGLTSSGAATMQMRINGTLSVPTFFGSVGLQDGAIAITGLPNGLSSINGTLAFNENRLEIRSLTARTGGGTLNIGGFVAYRQGLFFDLNATGKDIRLRYPPGISSAADADLRLAGTLQSALLSGSILVTRFGVNPKFDFASYLAQTKRVPSIARSNSLVDNLRLDIHVQSTPQLEVETVLAKISGDADMRLRGTLARPTVLGRVNIVEGDVYFSGTKYHLERGDIAFANPIRVEPILNIEASARVREYDITLGFHGSIDKLNTNYRSEPPLPTADIIALLALGRTRQDTALSQPTTENISDAESNAILGQALNAAISSRVQRLFGVSRIKIDPQVGGPDNNPNARLTIEQDVNNNITLTYITNLASSAQQVIQVEYNISKNVSIVAIRDQNGVFGFEIRARSRKK